MHLFSNSPNPAIQNADDQWGVAGFRKLPRAEAFARVFLFIVVVLAASFSSSAFKGQDFVLGILTKLDFLLAITLLYAEGVYLKEWFIKRFTWPESNKALIIGMFLPVLSLIAAAIGHYLLVGQLPIIERLPFSGHIFGYFLINLFLAFFEDISWRAFLLPRALHLLPGFGAVVGTGIMWGIWHIPFHTTLGLIAPDRVVAPVIYYTCVFVLYYFVWRLSAGSVLPLTISHAFYNTLVNFTIGHTLDLEGKSDTWLFYYCLIIALGISSCTVAIIIRRFSVRPEFEQ